MPDAWEVTTAIGTVFGGLGSMVAAIASWRSAKANVTAFREGREALGLALRPELQVDTIRLDDGDGVIRSYGRIMPAGPLDAAQVSATWRLIGGRTVHGAWSELPGWRPDLPAGADNSLRVLLPDTAEADVRGVDIQFFDARRVCQWQQSFEAKRSEAFGTEWVGGSPKIVK